MTNKKKTTDYKKAIQTLSKNYWAISTVILALLLIALLASGGSSGPTVSAQEAGQNLLSFANAQGAGAELVSSTEEGPFYEVVLSIEGQEVPLYVTKDGKSFTQQLVSLDATPSAPSTPSTPTPTNIPKNDKPVVEAFVMSHCPYGTQIEKGLLPVVETLGDKIDFELKFVYYAMHPSQGEVEEQLNQYCIQEEQNAKFNDYLTCFLEAGDGEGCLASTGIDTAKLETCTTAADAEFNVMANLEDQSSWLSGRFPKFDIHKADNEKYQVGGSPTLIINGAQAQAGRDSVSLLNAICAAFETAPEECNTEFEAGQPTPGFGWSTTTSANNAAAGCGV
jgi:hypothetical protein|tara:strand:- start:250 stop:1257 length:1008 start_codon:yes stop_codon:yes gene_type:complete